MKEFIVPTEIPEEIEFYEEHKCKEIVRCKDCKYSFEKWGKVCCSSILLDKITFVDADWFCADGEHK